MGLEESKVKGIIHPACSLESRALERPSVSAVPERRTGYSVVVTAHNTIAYRYCHKPHLLTEYSVYQFRDHLSRVEN